ncbi:MAG TPA: DUF1330 domain-containing protein [Xanthobacteraceae bacterium]|nr:DUF1330 domain-containing protein [Xanthobacteraceae bacterium]
MKRRIVTLAISLAALGIGNIAVAQDRSTPAQSKSPAYVVGEITVTNAQAYGKEYAPKAQAAVKAAGGKVIALGGTGGGGSGGITALQGTPPQRAVILEFPSMAAAKTWWNSPAFKKVRAIGAKYATFRNFAIEGAHLARSSSSSS